MCGDSICVASLYNPTVVMKNVLIKTSVMAVKQKCREIIKLFPKATIRICWMDGKSNSTSKLLFDNLSIMNSRLYRHGPENLHEESEDRVVFYKVDKDKEEWIPLPGSLIMRAREDAEKIQNASSGETFVNNQPELENCKICHLSEECGLILTRRMKAEKEKTEQATHPQQGNKRKMNTESCEGMGLKCKLRKIRIY